MPRKPSHVPSYRLHKPSGHARVIIRGEHIYLGKHGSPESKEKYARLIAEMAAPAYSAVNATSSLAAVTALTIDELILAYWNFAKDYYTKGGEPTKELVCMREALRPLRRLYGSTRAGDFGPKALKTVRRHMIDEGLSRGVINHRISRIKRVFKWAVAEELVPPFLYHGLQAVVGLQRGRTSARETEPVRPVPDEFVEALLRFVSPPVAAMVRFQRMAGMRPCEVTMMRMCDIDTSRDVWIYEPGDHKTRWRGHRKLIPLGPKAQEVLRPFLNRDGEAYLFSPRDADAWWRTHRAGHNKNNRSTPVYPSELRAREKAKQARRKRKPKRQKRERYDTDSYRQAIGYGIKKAQKTGVEIEHWHPNQLRHSRGTEIRKRYGVEGAQVVLGHVRADVTQLYAEKNLALAMKIAQETG